MFEFVAGEKLVAVDLLHISTADLKLVNSEITVCYHASILRELISDSVVSGESIDCPERSDGGRKRAYGWVLELARDRMAGEDLESIQGLNAAV